jgi:methyl-accepting chemotaxis protein
MQLKLALSFLLVAATTVAADLMVNFFIPAREHPLFNTLGTVSTTLLIGLIAAYFLSRYFTRHLSELATASRVISAGDLTRRVRVYSEDEVGQLAGAFNAMLENLIKVVREVGTTSRAISESAQTLSATSQEMNASTQEISSTVQHIAQGAETQASMVSKTSEVTKAIAKSIEEIHSKAQTVNERATDAGFKAKQGGEFATLALEKISEVAERVQSARDAVEGFRTRALEINRTVEFITTIASQTNLLALNAAIEAARAGEHGRGFAVVAEEVGKLAENAKGFADQIAELASKINSESANVIASMAESTRVAREGREVVLEANRTLEDIVNAVMTTVERVQEISALTSQQTQGAEELVRAIEEISKIAEDNAAGTEQASAATQEQTASMQELATSAQGLARTSDTLKNLVSVFRV